MRTFLLMLGWLTTTTCSALQIIAIEHPLIDATPYLLHRSGNGVEGNSSLSLKTSKDLRLPVTSVMQPGKVFPGKAHIDGWTNALFVVGYDKKSRKWLKKYAKTLRKLHAIGFVTNVAKIKQLKELETLAGFPLQPVNVDGLSNVLKIAHYPYVFNEGLVWQ